jgi:hypothetical protein
MNVMATYTTNVVCPHCGTVIPHHDSVPGQTQRGPFEGAYALCAYCLGLSVFTNGPMGLTLRPATEEESSYARTDPRFAELAERARQVREKKGK